MQPGNLLGPGALIGSVSDEQSVDVEAEIVAVDDCQRLQQLQQLRDGWQASVITQVKEPKQLDVASLPLTEAQLIRYAQSNRCYEEAREYLVSSRLLHG